jgi:hypothetical protein
MDGGDDQSLASVICGGPTFEAFGAVRLIPTTRMRKPGFDFHLHFLRMRSSSSSSGWMQWCGDQECHVLFPQFVDALRCFPLSYIQDGDASSTRASFHMESRR